MWKTRLAAHVIRRIAFVDNLTMAATGKIVEVRDAEPLS
jgi:acyl-coenzyme A synthetase/AMP-(fatty) acid ligase